LQLQSHDFASLFRDAVPLMDVRAPVEYARGTIPGAVNIPLLDNAQREKIGTEYAEHGQDAAIQLGLQSATQEIRQHRIAAWRAFAKDNPNGQLFCFRGGLRSRITQQWLADSGLDIPYVVGGYKAMRNWLISTLEQLCRDGRMLVVSSTTGSGKTDLLHQWSHSVDLEGLAQHRGSAFGGTFTAQPSQASWENAVTAHWYRLSLQSDRAVLFEAESHLIGKISLPACLQGALGRAPLLALETPYQERVERIRKDYIHFALQHFQQADPEHAMQRLQDYAANNLSRIQRRLGGERYQRMMSLLPLALEEIATGGDSPSLDEMIKTMLVEYYDPLYNHKISSRKNRIVANGDESELLHWLEQNS
jgi:tRNA 2-selenouridine synthase